MDNKKPSGNIASRVRELLQSAVEDCGVELWDVEYVKEAGEMILRLTIDKKEGVDLDDCERVHRTVDPMLDEADPIPVSYRLEVSSPGLERVLRVKEHFDYAVGQTVCVKLFKAVSGNKEHVGTLERYEDGDVTLNENGEELTFNKADISRVTTVYDFNEEG